MRFSFFFFRKEERRVQESTLGQMQKEQQELYHSSGNSISPKRILTNPSRIKNNCSLTSMVFEILRRKDPTINPTPKLAILSAINFCLFFIKYQL